MRAWKKAQSPTEAVLLVAHAPSKRLPLKMYLAIAVTLFARSHKGNVLYLYLYLCLRLYVNMYLLATHRKASVAI